MHQCTLFTLQADFVKISLRHAASVLVLDMRTHHWHVFPKKAITPTIAIVTSISVAVFQVNKGTIGDKWHIFVDHGPFLSPNHQCQSSEGNTCGDHS